MKRNRVKVKLSIMTSLIQFNLSLRPFFFIGMAKSTRIQGFLREYLYLESFEGEFVFHGNRNERKKILESNWRMRITHRHARHFSNFIKYTKIPLNINIYI